MTVNCIVAWISKTTVRSEKHSTHWRNFSICFSLLRTRTVWSSTKDIHFGKVHKNSDLRSHKKIANNFKNFSNISFFQGLHLFLNTLYHVRGINIRWIDYGPDTVTLCHYVNVFVWQRKQEDRSAKHMGREFPACRSPTAFQSSTYIMVTGLFLFPFSL